MFLGIQNLTPRANEPSIDLDTSSSIEREIEKTEKRVTEKGKE